MSLFHYDDDDDDEMSLQNLTMGTKVGGDYG